MTINQKTPNFQEKQQANTANDNRYKECAENGSKIVSASKKLHFHDNDNNPPPDGPAGGAALAVPKLEGLFSEFRAEVLSVPYRLGQVDESFLSTDLPQLNMAVEAGKLSAPEFTKIIGRKLSYEDLICARRICDEVDQGFALFVLGGLGAIASSLVRHERMGSGNAESDLGISLVPGLEEALIDFGVKLDQPPRDNHDTAWGEASPISYTGSEGEARFGFAVQESNRLLGQSADILQPIRNGTLNLGEGLNQIATATERVKEYGQVQADLAKNPFADDFLAMRNFLGSYTVGGTLWQPPNATYSLGWSNFELSLGLLPTMRQDALYRSAFMSSFDRAKIKSSIAMPTLWEIVKRDLGFDKTDGQHVGEQALLTGLKSVDPKTRSAVLAFRELARATARMAGIHKGAIKHNLVDPVDKMDVEERNRLGVAPTGGVSGTGLQHTFQRVTDRVSHPLVKLKVT